MNATAIKLFVRRCPIPLMPCPLVQPDANFAPNEIRAPPINCSPNVISLLPSYGKSTSLNLGNSVIADYWKEKHVKDKFLLKRRLHVTRQFPENRTETGKRNNCHHESRVSTSLGWHAPLPRLHLLFCSLHRQGAGNRCTRGHHHVLFWRTGRSFPL